MLIATDIPNIQICVIYNSIYNRTWANSFISVNISVQAIMLDLMPNLLSDAKEFSQLYNKHKKAFKLREKMTKQEIHITGSIAEFLKM